MCKSIIVHVFVVRFILYVANFVLAMYQAFSKQKINIILRVC